MKIIQVGVRILRVKKEKNNKNSKLIFYEYQLGLRLELMFWIYFTAATAALISAMIMAVLIAYNL